MIEPGFILDVTKQTKALREEIYKYSRDSCYPGNHTFFWFEPDDEEFQQQYCPLLLQYYKDSGFSIPLLVLVWW